MTKMYLITAIRVAKTAERQSIEDRKRAFAALGAAASRSVDKVAARRLHGLAQDIYMTAPWHFD